MSNVDPQVSSPKNTSSSNPIPLRVPSIPPMFLQRLQQSSLHFPRRSKADHRYITCSTLESDERVFGRVLEASIEAAVAEQIWDEMSVVWECGRGHLRSHGIWRIDQSVVREGIRVGGTNESDECRFWLRTARRAAIV
jgi:hypothetical protein